MDSPYSWEINARLDEGYAGELIKGTACYAGSSQPLHEPLALYYSNNSRAPEVQLYFSNNDPVILYTFAFLH